MSSVMGQPGHISAYIRNCSEMGIEVLPPSVLRSEEKFSVEGNRIRYGLAGIKNVGTGIVGAIIDARKDNPEPTDVADFVDGLDAKELNRKAVESMIKAGALDEINPNRAVMIAVCDDAVSRAQKQAPEFRAEPDFFFPAGRKLNRGGSHYTGAAENRQFREGPTICPWKKKCWGSTFPGHPLDDYRELIETNTTRFRVGDSGSIFDGYGWHVRGLCRAWSPPTDGIGTGTAW